VGRRRGRSVAHTVGLPRSRGWTPVFLSVKGNGARPTQERPQCPN
jgi:hypothetical protein